MTSDFQALFRDIFKKNGLTRFCDCKIIDAFARFTDLLQEENAHTNLTAIRDLPGMIAKHYADCLLAEPFFPKNATVLDVGCGGGFPTIPLAIARPDLHITAIDSTAKKIRFVEKAASALSLSNVKPICARIEAPELRVLREQFDIVTSRAMARTNALCELLLPFVKIGGQMVVLKGSQGTAELAEALRCIQLLGAKPEQDFACSLKTTSDPEERHILLLAKEKTSPPLYPRVYATILKKPL